MSALMQNVREVRDSIWRAMSEGQESGFKIETIMDMAYEAVETWEPYADDEETAPTPRGKDAG